MKPGSKTLLILLFSLVTSICVMSFHYMNVYKSCPLSDADRVHNQVPGSLIMPVGTCNCTTSSSSVGQQLQLTPPNNDSCHSERPSTSLQHVGQQVLQNKTACSSDCPPPEVRIVEKEVIREVVKKERCPDVPWYAEGKTWHYPARFPLCSMDACFNYSRCEGSQELLVYTYDLPSPPVRYFSRINESKYFTSDPQKACIFLVFLDNDNPWPPHPSTLPHWNGGLNHILVTFTDKWAQKGPPQDSVGFASVMASDIHETIYRAGFDISIPLPGNHHMRELQSVKALDRKYLATFRGLRYLGQNGEGTFRSLDAFREMHNGKDVIVATSCNHMTNNIKRKAEPALGVHCDEDNLVHLNHSFADLMNSTFGLVPAGVQPASYRFIEVLSAGAIPILIADNYVKPFDTLLQWHKCLLQFPTTEMHRILGTIRVLKDEEILKRQENCLQYYNEFFKDDETLMKSAVRALKARFLGAIPSFTELRR